MCMTCGCGPDAVSIDGKSLQHEHEHSHGHSRHSHAHTHAHDHAHDYAHEHDHAHPHPHDHLHSHEHGPLDAAHAPGTSAERIVQIEQDLLAKNNGYAQANRALFARQGIFALNLVSSPGSGKTTLLIETIKRWQQNGAVAVVEGDQQTSNDADRIRATGAPVVQINTGKGCHLDAHMVGHALEHLQAGHALKHDSLLLIENVGNLVCPAAFDLGEAHKVVILSATEGEDKPLKYPDMFRAADVMLLSKTDLLPYLDFEVDAAIRYAHQVNPAIRVIKLSTKNGEGFDEWMDWLQTGSRQARTSQA